MGRQLRDLDSSDRGMLERIAARSAEWTGTTFAFIVALASTAAWLVAGPYYGYSDTWQLVINTGTSIITFLMVFLIQRSQNRDMLAIKIQMSELIAAMEQASNAVIDLDRLSERQLDALHQRYLKMSRDTALSHEQLPRQVPPTDAPRPVPDATPPSP